MTKYETKAFSAHDIKAIDAFLLDGLNELPLTEYSKEVIGYVVLGSQIVITLKIYDNRPSGGSTEL